MQIPFVPATILLPRKEIDHSKWAVVACDQFTSQPAYWEAVEQEIGDAPSTLKITLPEVYLNDHPQERIQKINATMTEYLQENIFDTYENAMIFVRRTLPDGKIRHGILGAVDLAAYDYRKGATSPIRATEGTVLSRIPPRVEIRRDAPLELPHILLLIDDPHKTVIEPLCDAKTQPLYDFDLIAGGGHLRGDLLSGTQQTQVLHALEHLVQGEHPFLFAVGDGNHSLATAKTCYAEHPTPENRYALVEIVNIHDDALEFEPIYRVFFHADPKDVQAAWQAFLHAQAGDAAPQEVTLCIEDAEYQTILPHPVSNLAVGSVQAFADAYLAAHKEVSIDYIHGIDAVKELCRAPGTVGFLFGGMQKEELFPTVSLDGALPRKTFSMGEAASKRYYMEARKIKSER